MDETQAYEAVYVAAMELICTGETREDCFGILLDAFPAVESTELREAQAEAINDVRKGQMVDREDIHESWL